MRKRFVNIAISLMVFSALALISVITGCTVNAQGAGSGNVVNAGNNPTSYSVTYISEGGTPPIIIQYVTVPATAVSSNPAPPTYPGYSFAGWYTGVNGGGSPFTTSTLVTGDTYVYANWSPVITNTSLTYQLIDGGTAYSVSNEGTVTGGSVVIPASYNNLPVLMVGYDAFINHAEITNVVIPYGITNIGSGDTFGGSFAGCTGLSNIIIPATVESIAQYSFDDSGLTNVTISGSGLQLIGTAAFFGCSNLTSIILPSSLTVIGWQGFQDDIHLTNITVLAATPPSMGNGTVNDAQTFDNLAGNALCNSGLFIHVPSGSLSSYKATPTSTAIGNGWGFTLYEGIIVTP